MAFELTLDQIFALQSSPISAGPLNDVIVYEQSDETYYIKRYYKGGKKTRRLIGRHRLQGEYDNLLYFAHLNIPTPEVVHYEARTCLGMLRRGVLITKKVNAPCLKSLKTNSPEIFQSAAFVHSVSKQIATYTRRLHNQGFIHRDLKWRNILVEHPNNVAQGKMPTVYFFDCPLGKKRKLSFDSRCARDLYTLDKEARGFLSKPDRLRFLLCYCNATRLTPESKKLARTICARTKNK